MEDPRKTVKMHNGGARRGRSPRPRNALSSDARRCTVVGYEAHARHQSQTENQNTPATEHAAYLHLFVSLPHSHRVQYCHRFGVYHYVLPVTSTLVCIQHHPLVCTIVICLRNCAYTKTKKAKKIIRLCAHAQRSLLCCSSCST